VSDWRQSSPAPADPGRKQHQPRQPPLHDISELLAIYQKRLAIFKREIKALGIEVKVTASLGIWESVVEEVSS